MTKPTCLDRLTAEGANRSLRVQGVASVAAAREALARESFDLVLLDLAFPGEQGTAMDLLSELTAGSPPVPVLVLTASEAFTDRVEVARGGGRGFLTKSMTVAEVIDAAAQFLERAHAADIKVVAVDDDPAVLELLRILLGDDGLALTALSDGSRLWEVLEEVDPDLLILDVDMPSVGGIELCRTVRNDQRWAGLPGAAAPGELRSRGDRGSGDLQRRGGAVPRGRPRPPRPVPSGRRGALRGEGERSRPGARGPVARQPFSTPPPVVARRRSLETDASAGGGLLAAGRVTA